MSSFESPYLRAATSASGGYQQASTVPERFRATSRPIPGQSVVPPEYQRTSTPDIAKGAFREATPAQGEHTAKRDSRSSEQPADKSSDGF